jgi:hypothetical protein
VTTGDPFGTLDHVDRGFVTLVALFGLLVGFFAGRAYQAMGTGWSNYKDAKNKTSIARQLFWRLLGTAAGWILVLAIVVVVMVAWTAAGRVLPAKPRLPGTTPASVAPVKLPSPTPR